MVNFDSRTGFLKELARFPVIESTKIFTILQNYNFTKNYGFQNGLNNFLIEFDPLWSSLNQFEPSLMTIPVKNHCKITSFELENELLTRCPLGGDSLMTHQIFSISIDVFLNFKISKIKKFAQFSRLYVHPSSHYKNLLARIMPSWIFYPFEIE